MNDSRTIFADCWEQFTHNETLSCDGVIYLWGLDTPSIEGLTLAH